MKLLLPALWLATPVVWASWHFGPGQDYQKRDRADAALVLAKQSVAGGNFEAALKHFDEALTALPAADRVQAQRIRLARCQALLEGGGLPQAHDQLISLVEDLDSDREADREVVNGARESLAKAKYYLTWLMRLEGFTRDVWEPEIESARQHFRLLAESGASGDAIRRYQQGLESAIRLGRMELTELQGLPLPSECQGCKSGGRSARRPGKKPSQQKQPGDSRTAGSGPPADGEGN